MPFCSTRCKTIDLGRWLGENYSVPGDPLDEELGHDDLPHDKHGNGGFDKYSEGFDH